MSVRNTFWSLFATFFIVAIVFWLFGTDILGFFIKDIDAVILSTSVTSQFDSLIYIPIALLLLPFTFLLGNRWIKFRSWKQAWLFAGAVLIFGCIGFLLRWQLVLTTAENAPIIGGMKPMITLEQLQFEKYFFFGTLIGSLIVGVWMGYLNQKLTVKRSGML